MMDLLTSLFYPNPGRVTYTSPEVLAALALCVGLIVAAFAIRVWRSRMGNAVTKKLSRSWSPIGFWFGCIGLVMTVARVEKIQFLAMRFLWVLWIAGLLFALFVQYRLFRMRHYEVLPRATAPTDPRARYLPGRRK